MSSCASRAPQFVSSPWIPVSDLAFTPSEPDPDGVTFQFNLGTRRQNWNHARWAVYPFETPQDLQHADGILLEVTTAEPRRDVRVVLGIREADGSWYTHPDAVHLSAADGRNQGVALFEHFGTPLHHSPPQGRFRDDNDKLDLDAITGIALGIVNPLGVGEVTFTLTRLETVRLRSARPEPARVQVTGHLLEFNGTDTLPSGLFGGFHLGQGRHERFRLAANRTIHHTGLEGEARLGTPHTPIHINTVGDRVRPSPRLSNADWEPLSEALGRDMGRTAREAGIPLFIEYWNEPYLNWANYNRANFIPRHYDLSRAEEGGPVHIRHDGRIAPHLIWTRDRRNYRPFMVSGAVHNQFRHLDHWRRGRRADGRVLSSSAQPYRSMEHYYEGTWEPASHPPHDVADGETYEYNGQILTAFTPWHIVDTTQFTFWSGKGMVKPYLDPMLAFARGLREENPEATLIIGWGNRPGEDHWDAFRMLYQPVIDAAIDYIDAYNDHDYGGHPANMNAQYEVVTAYGVTRHNKWLYAYNTEAGSNSDPQVFAESATHSADLDKFQWVTRKMMHALATVPDKARVFLHFGDGRHTGGSNSPWWSDTGEGRTMELLINLRGRLLHTRSTHPDLYVVAAIDGTDPFAPRPDFLPDRKEFVVAVFNDRQDAREVQLDLRAPGGAHIGEGEVRFSEVINGEVHIRTEPAAARNNVYSGTVTLAPRELRVFTFPLLNSAALPKNPETWDSALPLVRKRQVFAHTLLHDLTPDTPVSETLALPEDSLRNLQDARIRFVGRNLGPGDVVATLNGKPYELPAALPPENNDALRELRIDPSNLTPETTLEIAITNPDRAGGFLGMFSLILESLD
jgi:hypothetical protein